jgi:hypothetical protein
MIGNRHLAFFLPITDLNRTQTFLSADPFDTSARQRPLVGHVK